MIGVGKRLKSNQIDVQRHYESNSSKRKTTAMNQQQSQPPTEKRQPLLYNEPVDVACNEPVDVAYEESIPSLAEQNQRLPKPRSVGAICQMCLHPLSKTGHLKHTDCSSIFSPLSNRSCMSALDCERFAPYGNASCGPVLGYEYTAEEQEKRLKIDLTRLKDDAAPVTNPPTPPPPTPPSRVKANDKAL